ncbi:polysaccharide biosynthesis C-terminal domain-containing protein [bacterium]|nr:polysaccharide biosynthesis C-terminal domain-containing protein [bacterium]
MAKVDLVIDKAITVDDKPSLHLIKQGFLRNSLSVGGLSAVGLLLSFASQVIVAAVYGMSGALDAYFLSLTMVSYFPAIYQSGIADPFIPVYVNAGRDRRNFLNSVFSLMVLLTIAYGIIILATSGWMLRLLAPGFDISQIFVTRRALAWFMLLPSVLCFISFAVSLLYIQKSFVLPKALSLLLPLSIVVIVWTSARQWGVTALVLAMLVGYVSQALALLIALSKHGFRLSLNFTLKSLRSENIARLLRTGVPIIIGISLAGLFPMIDRAFASNLGQGQIAALSYAERLSVSINAVLLAPFVTVMLPYLSDVKNSDDFYRMFFYLLRTSFFIFIPIAVFTGVFAVPIVDILFRRGAFTANDSAMVGNALRYIMVGLVSLVATNIIGRSFVVKGNTWILACLSPVALGLKFLLNLFLVPRMGLAGITTATSLGHIVFSIVNIPLLLGRSNFIWFRKESVFPQLGGALVAIVPAGIVASQLFKLWSTESNSWLNGVVLVVCGLLFLVCYGLALLGLRLVRFSDIKMLLSLRKKC